MKAAIAMVGLFQIIVILLSCHNDPGPTNIDINIDLKVLDKNGHNLLDSTISGYYKSKEIRIFFLENGVKTEVYNPRLDAPRNFFVSSVGNGQYFMRLFPNEGTFDQETTTTFLQWRQGDEDTLKTTMTRISRSVYCSKVFYNRELKYDVNTSQPVSWGNGIFKRLILVQK